MPRDDEKLLRQLSLVSFLLGRDRPATAVEIQRSVEGYALMTPQAFARRFYGDREELRGLGLGIESISDEGSETEGQAYYLPEENYYLPDLALTESETRSLAIALALLDGHFAYAGPLRLALANLTQGRPNPLQQELDRVAVSLAPDCEARELGKQLARLEEAVTRRKTVVFDYQSVQDDNPRERRLDPYGLLRIGGHWYVVGHDHERAAERTFRLGRMAGSVRFATKNPRDFEPPRDFNLESKRARPPWLLGEPQGQAVFGVREDLAWWVSRSFPELSPQGTEGELTLFKTSYADEEALLSWILSLGHQARLISPPNLIDELRQRLERLLSAHSAPPGREA